MSGNIRVILTMNSKTVISSYEIRITSTLASSLFRSSASASARRLSREINFSPSLPELM